MDKSEIERRRRLLTPVQWAEYGPQLLTALNQLLDAVPGFASDGRPEYLAPKAAEAYSDAMAEARRIEHYTLVAIGERRIDGSIPDA